MVQKLLWLSLAGAVGTLARYSLAGVVHRISGVSFPWGTLTVNIFGCFVAGVLWALFENRWPLSGETRVLVLVGFMGAFTTFPLSFWKPGNLCVPPNGCMRGQTCCCKTDLGLLPWSPERSSVEWHRFSYIKFHCVIRRNSRRRATANGLRGFLVTSQ